MRGRPTIRTYKDLREWQRAVHLFGLVHRVIRRIPTPERYDFGSQMRRAALSVSGNIAEGFGRDHLGDFLRSLSVARGSVMEVESDLLVLRAIGLVPDSELQPPIDCADEIGRMIASHARTLRSGLSKGSGPVTFFDR